MYILIVKEVEIDPQNKVEYSFKYDLDRHTLELDRVSRWTRRSKVSTRWYGTNLEGAEAPQDVVASALEEAKARSARI